MVEGGGPRGGDDGAADAPSGGSESEARRRKSVSWGDLPEPPLTSGSPSVVESEEARRGMVNKLDALDSLRDRGVLSERDHALKTERLRAKLGVGAEELAGLRDRLRARERKRQIVHALEMEDSKSMDGVPEGVVFRLQALQSLRAEGRAGKGCEIPNFKGSYLGRFPLVLADFGTSDHLSERSRP